MGEVKKLVENGRWVIPVEERPKDWRRILPDPDYPPATEPAIAQVNPTSVCVSLHPLKSFEPVNIHTPMSARRAVPEEGPTPATCKPKQGRWFGWLELRRAIERSARAGDWKGDEVEAAMILVAGMWCRDPEVLNKRIPGKNAALFAERCVSLGLWKDEGFVELGDLALGYDLDLWMRAGAIAGRWMLVREEGMTLFKSVGE